MSLNSLRPATASLRRTAIRQLATSRPSLPDFNDEPDLPELQIPSLGVYPPTGSNVLEIKSNLSYHTLAHTMAIVRAVESKCGRVVDISQPRFSDNQRARPSFTVTVLNPVLFDKTLILEIPQPDLTSSPRITHYGPSLQSVQSALSSSSSGPTFTPGQKKPKAEDVVSSTFTASVILGRPLVADMRRKRHIRTQRSTVKHDTDLPKRWAKEERAIRRVLGDGFKGFYGGFEDLSRAVELARKNEPVEEEVDVDVEPEVQEETAESIESAAEAEEVVKEDLAEGDVLLDKALEGNVRIPEGPSSSATSSRNPLPSTTPSPVVSTPTQPTGSSTVVPPTSQSVSPEPARPQTPTESKQDRLARLIRERRELASSPPLNLNSRAARAAMRGKDDVYQSYVEQKEQKSRAKSLRMKEAAERRRQEEEAKGALESIKNWFGF